MDTGGSVAGNSPLESQVNEDPERRSVKSSYQEDTRLGVEDNKFNKMLKSPTLEAHPRLEKKIRLMASRSLDRGRDLEAAVATSSVEENSLRSDTGAIPKQLSPSIRQVEETVDPNVVEIVKYSNDSAQLNKGSIIYIENDDDELSSVRMVQNVARSRAPLLHDPHISFDKDVVLRHNRRAQTSPIRRKSDSEHHVSNQIVSILKRKDVDSNSTSSNASPVTFSPSVVDTPVRSSFKQGILKKRSSLDESRYSRSHSPDDRSILNKNQRRNSLEETHGILKQPSVESKDDSIGSSHGILKKKESITPSGEPKHVSISQAVILAAVEICKDIADDDNRSYEIKPILKQDSQSSLGSSAAPKPILKKKHSSDGEEWRNNEETIRPILKSSRKSSRDENSDSDTEHSCGSSLSGSMGHRSILKTDSPAKRRSFCDPFETNLIMQRSKSLENPDSKFELPHTSPERSELPLVSVQERIRSMEQALNCGAIPKAFVTKREMCKERYKTHPVTEDEVSRLVFLKFKISALLCWIL